MARKDFHSVLVNLNQKQGLGLQMIAFQPSANTQLKYPCIVYSEAPLKTSYADDHPYLLYQGYEVSIISKEPNDLYKKALLELQFCSYSNSFIRDNLYHYVFNCKHIL